MKGRSVRLLAVLAAAGLGIAALTASALPEQKIPKCGIDVVILEDLDAELTRGCDPEGLLVDLGNGHFATVPALDTAVSATFVYGEPLTEADVESYEAARTAGVELNSGDYSLARGTAGQDARTSDEGSTPRGDYVIAVGPDGAVGMVVDDHSASASRGTSEVQPTFGSGSALARHLIGTGPSDLRVADSQLVAPMASATSATCTNPVAWSLLGWKHFSTYNWYFSSSATPWTTMADLQPFNNADSASGAAAHKGTNVCNINLAAYGNPNLPQNRIAWSSAYPDYHLNNGCAVGDNESVHGLKVFHGTSSNPPLAVACTRSSVGMMLEGDIAYNIGVDWYTGSGTCQQYNPTSPTYDFRTVATHEWGHTMGLNHTPTAKGQTMQPTFGNCQMQRGWGVGDLNGLAGLYTWF